MMGTGAKLCGRCSAVYNGPMTTANENERLAADVADLKVGQARLEDGQARLEERVGRLEDGQARLEDGQARLEERVGRLEAGQAELKSGLARLEAGQSRLEGRVDRLEGTVGRLVGAELEREVHANIVNIASRELGLNRVRILQSKIVTRSPEFQDAIDDAEEQNRINSEQGSHLERADVILVARRKGTREAVHVLAEISGLIGDRDITRARGRADTLSAIKGTAVIPVVVGGSIAPIQRTAADRQGVSIIVTPGLVP